MSVLRSKQFNDVYFSAQDGLAETRHVFLAGNGLPGVWAVREEFTIAETGFGTGLNFLAVWKLWEDCAFNARPKRLHYTSYEKYPLSVEEIRLALSRWGDEFGGLMERFLEEYAKLPPHRHPGSQFDQKSKIFVSKLSCPGSMGQSEQVEEWIPAFAGMTAEGEGAPLLHNDKGVTLTLIIGDVNEAMPKRDDKVDAWFLDGFRPATNPEMWTDTVFREMARMNSPGASFSTFTAAGFVRRGLEAAGFTVRKIRGYGRKREMLVGDLK